MSQRNRIFVAAVALAAAFTLAAPAPTHAAALRGRSLPAVDAWERAWEWLARLVPRGEAPPPRTARWEKEGGMINPDGSPKPGTAAPAPDPGTSEEGGAINPDGTP
jgi:hypothetical protein